MGVSDSQYEQERVVEIKQMLAVMAFKVAVPLFFIFWLLDLVYVPQYKWEFLAIRSSILPTAYIIHRWLKHIQTIAEAENCGLVLTFVTASILNTMIFIIGPGALYYIALHLVAIAILGYLTISNIKFFIAAFIIYGPYLANEYLWYQSSQAIQQFSVNSFFILGVLVITWFAKTSRERMRRLEFTMRRDLQSEIEKRKATEQKLIVARDNALAAIRAKDVFLANMSHEIRTPLTAIIGFAEYSQDEKISENDRSAAINTIVNSGNHLLNIVNDILDFSKIEANSIEIEYLDVNVFDVTQEVKSLVMPLASKKGLAINVEYQFPIPEVIHTDPLRIKQILINVCSNAIKFTAEGGVTITLAYDQSSSCILFKIKDTGIGMSEVQLEKIFEPFKQADSSITRKYGGTGLGLSLSRRLAELLGGSLRVSSIPEHGSEFVIAVYAGEEQTLKFLETAADIPGNAVENQLADSEERLQGNILLAEDNETNQKLLTLYLKSMGLNVDVAENGVIALERVNNHDYELILMDMQMPVMSGVEAVKELRKQAYNGPIIALTANATKEDRRLCYEVGFDDFVTKPITRKHLYETVANYMSKDSELLSISSTPITPSFMEDIPDIQEAVDLFVKRMPQTLKIIHSCYTRRDWVSLKQELHSLKGAAGGVGYPELTNLCGEIEGLLDHGDPSAIATRLTMLDKLFERIVQGLPH